MAVSHEEHTAAVIEEMRHEELDAATALFSTVWRAANPLGGKILIPDGSVYLQLRHSSIQQVAVVTHEHSVAQDISESGEMRWQPIATKYVIGVSGEPAQLRPLWATEKEYDLTPERQLAHELFDLTDDEVAIQFVSGFEDEKDGRRALEERKAQLSHQKENLHFKRDADVPSGETDPVERQLWVAKQLRDLLQLARQFELQQLSELAVRREVELED